MDISYNELTPDWVPTSGRGIEVVIPHDPNKTASVEAFGFPGTTCLEATSSLEELLGLDGGREMKRLETTVIQQKVKY